MVPDPRIRVVTLGVLLLHDHALFSEGTDTFTGRDFLRPIGGGVEPGETASDAAVRAFAEETGAVVEIWADLGTHEDLFEYLGEPVHNITSEFVVRLPADRTPLGLPTLDVDEGDHTHPARWVPLAEVLAGVHPLVPEGLHARLAAWVNRQ
ncbi:MAG: NUDIX domain-containing protein [Dehalococcoidia bacterium]|nr:NUDIX domain-containing protein [Dehalococcoidia bacterium]